MFRIEYLKLQKHPQLGDLELLLSDINEINNQYKPYTSVIIGPNGTGKSFILRTISDIFTQFYTSKTNTDKSINLPYYFHIRFNIENDSFEILKSMEILTKGKMKNFVFFKNRPFLIKNISLENVYDFQNFSIPFNGIIFPSHVIVHSIMLNDRFLFKKCMPNDFYQYLGVRSTSSTASTKSAVKEVINKLYKESLNNVNFLPNLKELLGFLEFDHKFEVEYNTKINKLFFSGNLTIKDFKQYYENWWDDNFVYSNRDKNNPIWSKPFYDKFYKNEETKIQLIIDFLNELSNSGRLVNKFNSVSKFLKIDVLNPLIIKNEFRKIGELEKLDIINLNGIKLIKNDSSMNISDISSGEFHLLTSLISIFLRIKENSLVLIDEPEISLHPNWQMQYITFLKKVFAKYSSCQFIITSHSHFIVSDLEGESSSVTALNRNNENKLESNLIKADTFGWSAEDILYNVFNVRSTWNPFLEADLTELLGLISINSKEKNKIEDLISKFKKLPTRKNDPLQDIIKEANKYLTTI
ncbi:MAG: AAA family ATPase [Bacteroidota bacterium]|nr:AAA family ATPase [Bacteroidota bacterium]